MAIALLIAGALCEMKNEKGSNVWKDQRTLSELPQHEVYELTVTASSYLNLDFPDDSTDGSEWTVREYKSLKLLNLIGQGHIYPSASTKTTIHRRTFSFQAKNKGKEDVVFVNAIKGKESEGKTYTIKFTVN